MMLICRKPELLALLVILIVSYSCKDIAVPKPKGYFRIDLPQREYLIFNEQTGIICDLPLSFEYPVYGKLLFQSENITEPGWFNIEFPNYKAKIFFTYRNINNDFADLMEQTYKMNVKNHIAKADAIKEQVFDNQENKVYGILYDLKGNTASAVQFYATDSIHHYLRGSLYFSSEPDADSLEPVINFFRGDIIHLIETLKWKK